MPVTAREYHDLSKHLRERVLSVSGLDWADEPSRVKEYPGAPAFELPPPLPLSASLADVMAGRVPEPAKRVSRQALATVMSLGYGITGVSRSVGGAYSFRAAPSAGALYPCELYLCCSEVDGLAAGIYYYNPVAGMVSRIREGDHRRKVAESLGQGIPAHAYFIITAIPYRSAWKYSRRAYRYCLFDSGHLAGNILLAGSALGLNPLLAAQFRQEALDRLLGLDGETEIATAVVPLLAGEVDLPSPPESTEVAEALPICRNIVVEENMLAVHREECWDGLPIEIPPFAPPGVGESLKPGFTGNIGIGDLVASRRSHRVPARRAASQEDLAAHLQTSLWAYPADWMPSEWDADRAPEILLLAFDVDGIPEGIYRYDPARRVLIPSGFPLDRDVLAAAAMGQRFVVRANALLVLVLDFTRIAAPGTYRVALLDAGVVGQFAYLAAESLGAGCCGIGAFFDDDFSETLGLDGAEHAALYGLTFAMK